MTEVNTQPTVVGKDSEGKLSLLEVDPWFIKTMATRLQQNKKKYPVFNWKNTDFSQEEILDALERHFSDLKCLCLGEEPTYNTEEGKVDHLAAIAVNCQILAYHIRNGNF